MVKGKINVMPTHSDMNYVLGDMTLSNAISKSGGTECWAKKLGLSIKKSESLYGGYFENICMQQLTKKRIRL